jgi:ppGpp synthetase/RelA/SpoT-type nucleotidyltranferase
LGKSLKELNMEYFEQQVTAFKQIRPVYEVYADVLKSILEKAVKLLGVSASVQVRAKEISSFAEKVVRKHHAYPDAVNQMCDLCGARVIVSYKDEIGPVCAYIRDNFEIDEANTEDVFERLGTAEFGYLSVHFTVSLKPGVFDDLLKAVVQNGDPGLVGSHIEQLFERRTADECRLNKLQPGPRFKAEVQVRTLLQHAWAEFAHDRLYKSGIAVPRRLMRTASRISAALENADAEFARTVKTVETFHTYLGPFKSRSERIAEKDKLLAVLQYDPGNLKLAHDAARLAISLEDWHAAIAVAQPFIEKWESSKRADRAKKVAPVVLNSSFQDLAESVQIAQCRDPNMAQVLLDYGMARMKAGMDGRDYLEWAVATDIQQVDGWICLADTYLTENPDSALPLFENAYQISPAEPRALGGFMLCKMMVERSMDFVALVRPSLEQAIGACRSRINAGVYVPQGYFDSGLFHFLCGRPYDSLNTYAKAVTCCDTASPIMEQLGIIDRLAHLLKGRVLEKKAEQLNWIRRFLVLAVATKLDNPTFGVQTADAHGNAEKFKKKHLHPLASSSIPELKVPVLIVAGGCGQTVEVQMNEYCGIIHAALDGFQGTILSGGTDAGISGLVGDWVPQKTDDVKRIAYLPRSIPSNTVRHEAYELIDTPGTDFSPLEVLQTWIDMLVSGIRPDDVLLMGINGGRISAFEYRMALALGAKVGLIRDSGRAASAMAVDPDWQDASGLLHLPNDLQSLRCFIHKPVSSGAIDPEDREEMARALHRAYRKSQSHRVAALDPALADWDGLSEDLRHSNRNLVDHLESKLKAFGYRLRKSNNRSTAAPSLKPEQIELMAEMEHGRWNVERLQSGWTSGERDAARRKTPYLVPWTELSEQIKDYDRQAVMNGLKLLMEFGYEIYK